MRFIPTPVGHTMRRRSSSNSRSVHPHACGAYWHLPSPPFGTIGSSPRLWGIRHAERLQDYDRRFIPTPVGHTCVFLISAAASTVHPHACGAYGLPFHPYQVFFGSSPRLWGIPTVSIRLDVIERFIPTPVGHTHISASCWVANLRFIPTPVGHTILVFNTYPCRVGSSPRLWGIRIRPFFYRLGIRFIPTPVGHTTD